MTTASLKVGNARSGRQILTYGTDDQIYIEAMIKDFNASEHFDAWTIFQRLAAREIRLGRREPRQYTEYELFMHLHKSHLTDAFIVAERTLLKLPNSPDLVRFAAQLTDQIFLD